MSLQRFFLVLKGRWQLVLSVLLGVVLLTLAANVLLPQKYVGESAVLVDSRPADPVLGGVQPVTAASAVMSTQFRQQSFRRCSMDANRHTMTNLFAQLGLAASPAAIEEFVRCHAFRSSGFSLCHAPFWSESQRNFLMEEIVKDADWVGVIDELNCRLHRPAQQATRR